MKKFGDKICYDGVCEVKWPYGFGTVYTSSDVTPALRVFVCFIVNSDGFSGNISLYFTLLYSAAHYSTRD